jgi:YVTN family beta-propeller protein
MRDDVLAPPDEATAPSESARPASELRAFLIADIRGYTSFTQRFGDERAAALTQRFADVTRAVVEQAGKVVELRGDEALCAFSSPRQALRAAAALQRRYVEETQENPELPLPVGIGIDVGEAVAVEDGYRGGALNLAARLCSIAGPGEILATTEVVHLARRLDGLSYVPRDAVRFKGIDEPVRPVQVVPEGEDPARQLAALHALPPTGRQRPKGPRWLPPPVRRRPVLSAGVAGVVVVVVASLVVVAVGRHEVTSFSENVAGIVDAATGNLVAQVPLGTDPTSVAVGSGAAWAVNTDDDTVARIDPATRSVTQVIDVGDAPTSAAVGGGSLWVTNSISHSVSRIDPGTDRVQQTLAVGATPSAVAFYRGALWVTDTAAAALLRVDPVTGAVARIGVGDAPSAVVAGNGSLWVSNSVDGTVSQIDPAQATALPPVHVGGDPRGLALDGDSLWVANNLDGTVTRIRTATGTVAATIPVGGGPVAVAVAAGRVWVADQDGAALTEIDPVHDVPVATVPTASQPADVVAAGTQLWVATGARPGLHRGGTFTALVAPNLELNPDSPDSSISRMLYDGLVTFRRAPGAAADVVIPDLAVDLPQSGDGGLTYTFKLRPGVRWSTGDAVTASDIRRGIERWVAAGASPDLAIVGADKCTPDACDLSTGVAVDDAARTVTIRLSKPDSEFFDDLAGIVAVPVPMPQARVHRTFPTTGPYTVEQYRPKASLVLVRNPYFHEWSHAAQPAGFPDRLAFTVDPAWRENPDQATISRFDWLDVIQADLTALRSRFGDRLHITPDLDVRYLFLNASVPPFDNPDARRAVSYAIDRDAVKAGWSDPSTVACQVLPPTVPGYRPYCPYTLRPDTNGIWRAPDLATAQRLVQRSGTAGTPVTVWISPFRAEAMQPVVDAMNEIGYRVTLQVVPDSTYLHELTLHPEAQAGMVAWPAAYPSASQFAYESTCAFIPTGQNFARFCDPSIDASINTALALEANSPQQAGDAWALVDRALTDAAPLVPMLIDSGAVLLSSRVRHYETDFAGPLFDQLWLK